MPSRILPRRSERRFSLAQVVRNFITLSALRRQRRRLALLDDHLLRDIGVSLEAALCEAERKDWDAPERWTR